MAIKKIIEIDIDDKGSLDDLTQGVQSLNEELVETQSVAGKGLSKIEDGTKKATKGTKSLAKGFKGVGTAIKAAGIGIVIALIGTLTDIFRQNQTVVDGFTTTFNFLSIAFNDFANFVFKNFGKISQFFKDVFSLDGLKSFGEAIKNNIIERFNSMLELAGLLAKGFKQLFEGDFAGAVETAKEAGKEFLDVLTGIDDVFDKTVEVVTEVTEAIVDYTTSTIEAARQTTNLANQALIAEAVNRGLIETFDRQAEQLRQIRDDDLKGIDERIEANRKLGEILNEQEKLMLANADAIVAAAQAELSRNNNIENQVALIDAQNERLGVQAQIEGFRSEQLSNINSLLREQQDIEDEAAEKEKDRQEKLLKDTEDRTKRLAELDKQRADDKKNATDAIIGLFEAETAAGRAALLAKQILNALELIEEVKKTITFSTLVSARSTAAVAEGAAQTAKVGFPQNIPLLIAYAAQAVGIIGAVSSAIGKTKSAAASIGGGGGSVPTPTAPSISAAPQFNVVGATDTSQLAQSISEERQQPIEAFVVAAKVTTQQALDRNKVNTATFGT